MAQRVKNPTLRETDLNLNPGVPTVAQRVKNPTSIHENEELFSGFGQLVKYPVQHAAMS